MLPNSSFMGVVIAVLYLGAMLGTLWWMLAARPAREKKLAAQVWPYRNSIVVPLTGSAESKQALKYACDLASRRHASLVLAHVIEIPMTLGLDVPLEAAEERGRSLLAEGESIAREFDVPVESRLIRHRRMSTAILELGQEVGASTIVFPDCTPRWWSLSQMERAASELMRRSPSHVVLAKAPLVV